MSWSVEYNTSPDSEPVFIGADDEESNEAIKVIVDGVGEIIKSGVLGNTMSSTGGNKVLAVRIGGHTNPGHEPVPGFSNDYVNINVYQMDAR